MDEATATLGRPPDLWMMHELPESPRAADALLSALARRVKRGQGQGIGVSNVQAADLERLYARSVQLGCPIRCVENRFSPYHRDDAVRSFCSEKNIRYVGYGLMGSTQKGACVDEGYGEPGRYLLAAKDPRLRALSDRCGVSVGELVIGWAASHGVSSVLFSTRPERIEANLAAGKSAPSADVMASLDAVLSRIPEARLEALEASTLDPALKALFRAHPDPSAWSILDALVAVPAIAALLGQTAESLASAAPPTEQSGALKNFAQNLVRHVADMQSAGFDDGPAAMIPSLTEVAESALGRPEVAARFAAWASKDATLGGGFTEASARFPEMLAPPPSSEPELRLDDGWKIFLDESYSEEVAAPKAGERYAFYRLHGGEPDMFSATVTKTAPGRLRVQRD